jgi:BirA family biotin operon repressor/biotin-[acetyl-CoA-carboxylase] ligase
MASTLVRPQPGEGPRPQLSFVAALALWDALVPPLQPERLRLKWPNDLLLDGAKVSGILLEGQGSAVVIGIGVNLVSAPGLPDKPTVSLAAAGIAPPPPDALLDRLARAFAARRSEWRSDGFATTRDAWLARASGLGQRLVARFGEEALTGRFEGLAEDGALELRLDDGRLRAVHAGEVFPL